MSKITLDMIDHDLAVKISAAVNNDPPLDYSVVSITEVKKVLAWLSRNPVELRPEDQSRIAKEWDSTDCGWTNYVKFIADRTQRIAYFKKEEPLPEDMQDLIKPYETSAVREVLIKAYKLGLSRK